MAAAGAIYIFDTGSPSFPPSGADRGVCPFWVTCTIDDSAMLDHVDDKLVLVGPFPDNTYMPNSPAGLFVDVSDMDTGGPTLDIDFGIGGVDGVLDYTLINSGGAGGAASALAATPIAGQGAWLDVSGLYVIGDLIGVSATHANGTIQVGGLITQNVINYTATV